MPYSKDTIDGHAPPPMCDWVFPEHYEEKFRKFLQVDDDQHRREHNFLIKPCGPIWNKLCNMYNLQEDIVKGASHIFRYTKEYSTLTHYSFAAYRADNNWRRGSLRRFEIQPIIDITRLPEFHYLAYEKSVQVVEDLYKIEHCVPEFARIPDFFLPSRNLKYIFENFPEELESDLESISQLIGISDEDIRMYVSKLKEKIKSKEERDRVLEQYKDSPLLKLTVKEMKFLLDHFKYKCHSSLKVKADFLVVLDELAKKNNMDEKEMARIVKK